MSFNQDTTGKSFIAGEFLADDECTRITIEAAADNAAVVTNADGSKYIPAGTIYPANDATAQGIIYEHVDVSTGNMPASLVVAGKVYEDRLPQAVDTYSSATVPTGGNPKELGLYERSGTSPNFVYTLTTDTTAAEAKTYYSYDGKKIASAAKTALTNIQFLTLPTVTRPFE